MKSSTSPTIDASTGTPLPSTNTNLMADRPLSISVGAISPISPIRPIPAPDLSQQWAEEINSAFQETHQAFSDGLRKAAAFGALLNYVKEAGDSEKVIPRGQFLTWIKVHCPDISIRTAQVYMQIADGICKKLQIRSLCVFDDLPLHKLLSMPSAELSQDALEVQSKVLSLIEGKTQQQLLLDFREIDPRRGGDKVWEAWLRIAHPELVKDGKYPNRRQVTKTIREEFTKHQLDQRDPVAKIKFQTAQANHDVQALIATIRESMLSGKTLALVDDTYKLELLDVAVQMNQRLRKLLKQPASTD